MEKLSLVRKDLLRRKIVEHFSKKPKSKTATFKMGEGRTKTHWRVFRESVNVFRVYEVKSNASEFLIEQPLTPMPAHPSQPSLPSTPRRDAEEEVEDADDEPGEDPESTAQSADPQTSPDPAQAGVWDPDNPESQFALLVRQVGLNNAMLAMPDDKLLQHFGISKAALKGGGTQAIGQPLANPSVQPDDIQLSHRKVAGRMLREDPLPGQVPTNQLQRRPEAGPEPTQQNTVGLDNDPADIPEEKPEQWQPKTVEEFALRESLKGQTISGVEIEKTHNSYLVHINLVTTSFPATIEYSQGGRVVFKFKDIPYLLQPKWS